MLIDEISGRIYLRDYSWEGITGKTYNPSFYNGGWHLVSNGHSIPIKIIGAMCNIPEDELLILMLRYGS